jgi:hypothetical protein
MSGLKQGWLAAGLMTAGLAFASQAEATVYDGMTQAQVEAVLTSGGKTFKKISTNFWELEQGRRLILASCPAQSNGTCYEIYVVDKYDNVRPTLQGVNQWNNNSRAPEASVNDQGLLELTMFVSTVGITEKLLLDTLSWLDTAEQQESFNSFWRPYLVSPGM